MRQTAAVSSGLWTNSRDAIAANCFCADGNLAIRRYSRPALAGRHSQANIARATVATANADRPITDGIMPSMISALHGETAATKSAARAKRSTGCGSVSIGSPYADPLLT